jgi:hypothetical protein
MADNASLKNTDIPKRFDAALQSLAGNLAQLTACQVEEKRNEAAAAEGEWNLQSLRCDQILDEARDEAAYLDKKEDLKKSMSEAGRLINLTPLDSARDKVRAAKRRQQEAALEKLKLAGQVSQLNLQSELLDDNAGKLDEAVSQANDASDRAVDRIQEAIDQ